MTTFTAGMSRPLGLTSVATGRDTLPDLKSAAAVFRASCDISPWMLAACTPLFIMNLPTLNVSYSTLLIVRKAIMYGVASKRYQEINGVFAHFYTYFPSLCEHGTHDSCLCDTSMKRGCFGLPVSKKEASKRPTTLMGL